VDLMRAMNVATQNPPPTSIDVDRLISGEFRRRRTIDRTAGAAIVFALVIGALMLPQFGNTSSGEGPPPPEVAGALPSPTRVPMPRTPFPSVIVVGPGVSDPADALPPCQIPVISQPSGPSRTMSPAPRTPGAKSCEDMVALLRNVLPTVLHRELPGETLTNADGSALPPRVKRNWYSSDHYESSLLVRSGGRLSVTVYPSTEAELSSYTCADINLQGRECSDADIDGRRAMVITDPNSQVAMVWILHADGTLVTAATSGDTHLTKEQLIQIAKAPEITVF
jgi:hypothetical protein